MWEAWDVPDRRFTWAEKNTVFRRDSVLMNARRAETSFSQLQDRWFFHEEFHPHQTIREDGR